MPANSKKTLVRWLSAGAQHNCKQTNLLLEHLTPSEGIVRVSVGLVLIGWRCVGPYSSPRICTLRTGFFELGDTVVVVDDDDDAIALVLIYSCIVLASGVEYGTFSG